MDQIKEWVSSLWNSESASREMDSYTYEPILSKIVSNVITLSSPSQERRGIMSYLYFGVDEGIEYIKLVRCFRNTIKEEKYIIRNCDEAYHYLRYQCVPHGIANGGDMEIVFSRVYTNIEMRVQNNRMLIYFYAIDARKKDTPFQLFNNKKGDSELYDIYKMEKLFE